MAVIKVKDLAYGRLRAPDLDAMEEFLIHFGMRRADRTKDALYMRGTDPDHHLHITELGEPAFVGFAYHADSEADLERVAATPGASDVEDIDDSHHQQWCASVPGAAQAGTADEDHR